MFPLFSSEEWCQSKSNKIAQGDISIFSHLTFFQLWYFFATLIGNDASHRQCIIISVIRRSISVKIDTSQALFQKLYFWQPFWIFLKTRSAILMPVVSSHDETDNHFVKPLQNLRPFRHTSLTVSSLFFHFVKVFFIVLITRISMYLLTLWDKLGGWKILIKAWTQTKVTVDQQQLCNTHSFSDRGSSQSEILLKTSENIFFLKYPGS